jgi:hypothetical protein
MNVLGNPKGALMAAPAPRPLISEDVTVAAFMAGVKPKL